MQQFTYGLQKLFVRMGGAHHPPAKSGAVAFDSEIVPNIGVNAQDSRSAASARMINRFIRSQQ